MRVLHVAGSPRARSRSRRLAQRFLEALGPRDVTTLDVWKCQLPDLGGEVVEARYQRIRGEPVARDLQHRWGEIHEVARQALDHDLWLISTPMWNFGIPYRLKHWIDCIIHPGMTFSNDALGNVTGFAAGKTVILAGAGALELGEAAEQRAFDFQMRYLETILQFIGIDDIHSVRAAPTFGPAELVDRAEELAVQQLEALAATIRNRAGAPD